MNNNALQVFNYKEQQVRTVIVNGEVWFVAKDVGDILELTNPTVAIEALDEDERSKFFLGRSPIHGGGGEVNIINESGLYALIFRSNKPEAKAFSRWVRHDVLPSIRKTGIYSVQGKATITFDPMQGARAVFEAAGIKDNQLALAMDKVYRSYTGRSALEAGQIMLNAPTNRQLLTPSEIGAIVGLKAHRVNKVLARAGLQHKINGKWEVLPPGEGYAVMQDTDKRHLDGTPVRQLKWDASILPVMDDLQYLFG